ncbi:MAG: nuclear transport factor 2 family protein [Halobacteriota archaeon]
MDRANLYFREGEVTGFENVSKYATADVAWTVEVGRFNARVAGGDLAPVALRVTSIFRREDGVWKLVHRHADPVISGLPPESIVQR